MAGEMRIRRGRGLTRRTLDAAGAGLEGLSVITRLSSGALTAKLLLVKAGADVNHVALCGAADTPLGVALAVAAGAEENIDLALLPGNLSAIKMVASAVIAVGALVEPAANGRVATLGGTPGTHHVVGRAMEAAAGAGSVISIIPMYFLR